MHNINLMLILQETVQEQATKRALSLQHVKERNRELWRQKEMKRRYEQKAMMQNKSKSRKYVRICYFIFIFLRQDELWICA